MVQSSRGLRRDAPEFWRVDHTVGAQPRPGRSVHPTAPPVTAAGQNLLTVRKARYGKRGLICARRAES
eukprot:2753805-Alexandrium_andersonii.AAC.1